MITESSGCYEALEDAYKEFSEKYYTDGYQSPEKNNDEKDIFKSCNRVKFDLFKKFGLIAAAGDRHLAEFMPSYWYLKDHETVKKWKFMLTPVDVRVEIRKEADELRNKIISGKTFPEIKPTGEEGVKQLKALLGLGDLVTNVNLPNYGQMQGFPLRAVVETNAVFSRDCIKPVIAGKFQHDIHNLVVSHSENHELILKAVLSKDIDLAYHAFMNDPLVNLNPDDSKKLFIEMVKLTSSYLPGWKI